MFGFGRKAYLKPDEEMRIVEAINQAETKSRAEIRVHLSAKIRKDVYTDAVDSFRKLGMYKTEFRNGVLIYVVPSVKEFAIVGDIGIHEKVQEIFWQTVKNEMILEFKEGDMADGIIKGIEMAGVKLAEYFPMKDGQNPDELSNHISRG